MSSEKAPKQLTIAVFAMDGIGHLNACVGMAQTLLARGHRIKFLINDAYAGKVAKFGFEEVYLKVPVVEGKTSNEENEPKEKRNPVKEWAQLLITGGFLNEKTPLEKLKSGNESNTRFVDSVINGLIAINPQLQEVLEREKPDLVIVDHFVTPPALPQSGIPYMCLFSGSPLHLYGSDKLPPFGAGFPVDSDPATWTEYGELQHEKFVKLIKEGQARLNKAFNYEPPPSKRENVENEVLTCSDLLNIYGYPKELDYNDIVPRPSILAQVDAFCLESPEPFVLPETFDYTPGKHKLIYVSLGSMGSVDVKLMTRIVSVLAKTPHRYIVSKGPLAEEYDLPPNCWGEAFLPQTKILPLVDLVITHGGNNTVTETFTFGKPMIVMPLFADQYDNGQRLTEKGYGARLNTYLFEEQELIDTIERLLNDKALLERCANAGKRMRSSDSKVRVAKQIEEIVYNIQSYAK